MKTKRIISLLLIIAFGLWFIYEVFFAGNVLEFFNYNYETDSIDNVVRNMFYPSDFIRGLSIFFAYLFFAFIPFIIMPAGLYRFLKYSVYLLPFTIFIFIYGPSTSVFAPGINEVSIGLALLHIPVALFAMYREQKLSLEN